MDSMVGPVAPKLNVKVPATLSGRRKADAFCGRLRRLGTEQRDLQRASEEASHDGDKLSSDDLTRSSDDSDKFVTLVYRSRSSSEGSSASRNFGDADLALFYAV